MCGISGIVNLNNTPVSKAEILTINNLVRHRGPDAEGFLLENNFALGHRRLSIIDVSAEGNQPMFYNENAIVFNGEVYNYIEIKDELTEKGYSFKNKTDTEVILAAYDCWGDECVSRFNGMWSFCLFDKKNNKLFCSRDRYGIKPFYYSLTKDKFVFGSEIKQMLYYIKDRYVNQRVLMDYILGYSEYDIKETFFEGVFKLAPSHNLHYDLAKHEFTVQRYYELKVVPEIAKLDEEQASALIEKEFKRSVSIRMRSDVKVGTCLSGGMDSSTIAAYASDIYAHQTEKFCAIHAKSIEKETDESEFASLVARNNNLDFKMVEPETVDFFKNIEEVIKIQEEPFGGPSIYMQYFVFKEAKRNSCHVMLDGQGGDEVFLGYERYYLPTLKYLRPLARLSLLYKMPKLTKLNYKRIAALLLSHRFSSTYIFLLKKRAKYIKKRYLDNANFVDYKNSMEVYEDISRLQKNELNKLVLPQLLKVEDRNSMHHSIESRLPFLDYKLVETVYSTNNAFKIKDMWSKYLMRKMVKDKLPKEIVWRRKKLGFAAPSSIWLKDKSFFLKKINESLILKEVLAYVPPSLGESLLWRLYNISVWEQQFNVTLKAQSDVH